MALATTILNNPQAGRPTPIECDYLAVNGQGNTSLGSCDEFCFRRSRGGTLRIPQGSITAITIWSSPIPLTEGGVYAPLLDPNNSYAQATVTGISAGSAPQDVPLPACVYGAGYLCFVTTGANGTLTLTAKG